MSITQYMFRRLIATIPTLIAVTILVFLMLQLIPGDPAEAFLGERRSTPELLAIVRHEMGLDRPLYLQYLSYIWNFLHGDFGKSLLNKQPVTSLILENLPPTVQLSL
jgi:ABC-type dipeptide/oligopeptide/nickel transport system permease component